MAAQVETAFMMNEKIMLFNNKNGIYCRLVTCGCSRCAIECSTSKVFIVPHSSWYLRKKISIIKTLHNLSLKSFPQAIDPWLIVSGEVHALRTKPTQMVQSLKDDRIHTIMQSLSSAERWAESFALGFKACLFRIKTI